MTGGCMYFRTAEARDELVEPYPDPPFVSLVALEPDKDGKLQVPKDHPAFKFYHGDEEDDNAPPPLPNPTGCWCRENTCMK